MSDQSSPATEQPAQVAQTSSETKGASNTSSSDFARRIAKAQMAPAPVQKTETIQAKAETPAPVTEEAKAPPAEVKETGTETETKAETAEATETETDEVLSPENHSLDPKLKQKIERRIGKEVAKRKELERKVASLEALVTQPAQVEEKEVIVPAPANVPLAEITTPAQLEQLKQTAKQELRWAERWLDEDIPAEGIQTDRGLATKKQLKELMRNAREVQEDLIPQREKFLNSRQSATQTAHEKFPFLKDPSHPGYQMAKTALRENPVLLSYPNADYLVGMLVKGQLAMQAEAEGKTPLAKPRPKPTNGQSEIASDASITRAPIGIMNNQALSVERAKIMGGKNSIGHKGFAELLKLNQKHRNSQ